MHRYILHNESVLDSSTPCLNAGQVGLLAGWGVFSTIRVSRGVLFAFDRHYQRLRRDAGNFRIPLPEPEWLRARLMSLIRANAAQDATLRVVVVRNTGGVWAGPSERAFDVLALTADLADWGETVRLGVVPQARNSVSRFSGAKVTSWGANLTWYEEAHLDGFDEVVLLNERDQVSECTSANIFAVDGNSVWTPPLSSGCLPGVTRELLLTEVRIDDIAVQERELTLQDLMSADEVFITSTTRDLLPVVSIGGQPTRQGRRVCDALQNAFGRYVTEYTEREARTASGLTAG
jgi:branched-chain amino acid aminotransferase